MPVKWCHHRVHSRFQFNFLNAFILTLAVEPCKHTIFPPDQCRVCYWKETASPVFEEKILVNTRLWEDEQDTYCPWIHYAHCTEVVHSDWKFKGGNPWIALDVMENDSTLQLARQVFCALCNVELTREDCNLLNVMYSYIITCSCVRVSSMKEKCFFLNSTCDHVFTYMHRVFMHCTVKNVLSEKVSLKYREMIV